MNTLLTAILSWMWGAMALVTPIEAHSGPAAAAPQPPPSCATASSASTGTEACKATSAPVDRVLPRKGDTIYNGI